MGTIHRIGPGTWDQSIIMHADVVDSLRKECNVRHPSYNDMETLLSEMRTEFDDFSSRWYGAEPPDDPADEGEYVELQLMWFRAFAIMSLDLHKLVAARNGTTGTPTAGSLYSLLRGKMEDYGWDNIRRFGKDGLIVRLHDKVARLENLGRNKAVPNNESVLDTLDDIVGYCLIACMVETDEWELPLEDLYSSDPE